MDLRSIINSSDRDGGAAAAPASKPSQQQQQQQRHQQPAPPPQQTHQSPAQQQYRDYPPGPHPHQSPGGPPHTQAPYHQQQQQQQQQQPQQQQQQQQAGAYPYGAPGQYPRSQPPGSHHQDSRSPTGSMHAPSASPYGRPAATPSGAPHSALSYFPSAQPAQDMSSPAGSRQPYPPQHARQESYPPHPAASYPGVPQTPPVGGPHPYAHQRGPSAHSSPTPTSAHSLPPQQQRYDSYHGSPRNISQPHPSAAGPYGRPPSQPPTPGGGPPPGGQTPGARASGIPFDDQRAAAAKHQQHPPSPYQQRNSQQQQSMLQGAQPQASPHHEPQPLLQRSSTSYESHSADQQHPQHPRSQRHSSAREREDSEPISPKTRVLSLPPQQPSQSHQQHPAPTPEADQRHTYPQTMATESDRTATPAKRKLEDRGDVSPRGAQAKHARGDQVNGQAKTMESQQRRAAPQIKSETSQAPTTPRQKRVRRAVPPRWAQSVEILKGGLPKHPNYIMQQRVHAKPSVAAKPANGRASRHPSPEASRSAGAQPSAAAPAAASHPPVSSEPRTEDILRPWEPSLTGRKPYEEATKILADEFFNNIIRVPDLREIQSLGIKFEIEAKLGELLDRRTNQRVNMGLRSEAILDERAHTFRSSMSEDVHRRFNEFLNDCVVKAHPQKSAAHRVKIDYLHRREIDRFYELSSPDLLARLPTCIRSRCSHGKRPRVRVTHDSKTGQLLGKIVKARVCDVDLHMPNAPMDCRVSVNLEMDWEGDLEGLMAGGGGAQGEKGGERNKDRLSYSHGHYQVDLTQVTQNTPQGMKKEHELEIELSADMVLDQGNKVLSGQNHRYSELIDGFLDNVRLLARKAGEWQR